MRDESTPIQITWSRSSGKASEDFLELEAPTKEAIELDEFVKLWRAKE